MAEAMLRVNVQPRASRTEIAGWRDDVLRVRVTAPPEDGRANAALIDLIAGALDVSKSHVAVVRGHASREKTLGIEGLTSAEVRRRLGGAAPAPGV